MSHVRSLQLRNNQNNLLHLYLIGCVVIPMKVIWFERNK